MRSKIFASFESPYMISYITSLDTFSPSRTVSEIFDFKVFRVRPCFSNLKCHMRLKIFAYFESSYMTSYLTSIDTFSLSRTISEIFDFKIFKVRPCFSTLIGHMRSKIFASFESPYMTSYLTSIDTFSLSRTFFEILDFKVFRVRPCFSTLKSHTRSKIFASLESPYMTSYLTSIDTFSLSLAVCEIFDFNLFGVRPCFSTLKSHIRSKIFASFESPYMTSYLTSIDTFSLSRAVSEIFDFKVFRVRPCFSTLKCHMRSKNFASSESPYMTFYLTSIDTFSLSRTVSEIFDFKLFRVRPCFSTLKSHMRSKIFVSFRKPIHDFLSNFH